MSHIYDQRIDPPTLDAQRRPLSYRWRGRPQRISAWLDRWEDVGAWWDQELPKRFWRCELQGGGVVELWQDSQGGWALYRVLD